MSATWVKFSLAVSFVLTSTQKIPQKLGYSVAFLITLIRAVKNLPLTDFVCNLKTYLTLSLAAHSSDNKTSLIFTLLGGNYS